MTTDLADGVRVPAAVSVSFQQIVAHCGRLNLEAPMAEDAPIPRDDARGLQDKLYREIGVAAVAEALHLAVSHEHKIPARSVDGATEASYRAQTRAA